MDEGPPEKVTGVPTVVLDQLVKGVVAADVEVELDELPPPAHATRKIGIANKNIFFKATPNYKLLCIENERLITPINCRRL